MTRRHVLLAICLLASAAFPACRRKPENQPLPPEVQGVWRTTDARYADRYLELRPGILTLGVGEDQTHIHVIRHVAAERNPEGTLYTVTYLNREDGVEDRLAFYFSGQGGGTIRFKNQPKIVWAKEE